MLDISGWSLDKIMQLPDHAFGRRYLIITRQELAAGATVRWLVKDPLPDRFILWSIRMGGFNESDEDLGFRFAFGSEDPADVAAFDRLREVFPGDFDDPGEKSLITMARGVHRDMRMRIPFNSNGERFVVSGVNGGGTLVARPTIEFEISSIPRGVGEWLVYPEGTGR